MKAISYFFAGLIGMLPSLAQAGDRLYVPDASVIQYTVGQDQWVRFRNFNEIDSTWLGCCSSYLIDISTDVGKAQFSTFLTAAGGHSPISFFVNSKATEGPILQVGKF